MIVLIKILHKKRKYKIGLQVWEIVAQLRWFRLSKIFWILRLQDPKIWIKNLTTVVIIIDYKIFYIEISSIRILFNTTFFNRKTPTNLLYERSSSTHHNTILFSILNTKNIWFLLMWFLIKSSLCTHGESPCHYITSWKPLHLFDSLHIQREHLRGSTRFSLVLPFTPPNSPFMLILVCMLTSGKVYKITLTFEEKKAKPSNSHAMPTSI